MITENDQSAAEDWLNANNDRLIDALDLAEAFARHRLAERAAIVAWLRAQNSTWATDSETADCIEAGEHLK